MKNLTEEQLEEIAVEIIDKLDDIAIAKSQYEFGLPMFGEEYDAMKKTVVEILKKYDFA